MKNQFTPAYAYRVDYPYAQQLDNSTYPGNTTLSVGTFGPFNSVDVALGLFLAAAAGSFSFWATKRLDWSLLHRLSVVILSSGFGFILAKLILGIITVLRQSA